MYLIDTAETIRKLTAADMPEAQARVIVDTLKHPDSEVATKTDIRALKAGIGELRQELKTDTKGLRQELKADIRELQTEIKWIKWAIGVNLGFTLLIVGKLLFF